MKRFVFVLPMILLAAMTGCDNAGDSRAIAPGGAAVNSSVVAVPTDSDQFLKFLNNPDDFDPDNPDDDDPNFDLLNENDDTAEAYYAAIDPENRRLTLSDWLAVNGFGAFNPANRAVGEIDAAAVYFNRADLGFGRRMSLKVDSDGNVAACVENFRSLEDAVDQRNLLVTVCMEYGPTDPIPPNNPNPDLNQKFTKFYVFAGVDDLAGKQEGERKLGVDLDGRGFKHLPGQCNICHGGRPKPLNADGSYPDAGNFSAFFLPWDLETFDFATTDPALSRERQEDAFRKLNQGARVTYQAVADPEHELAAKQLVEGWYGGTDVNGSLLNQTFESVDRFVPPDWEDERELYLKVIAPSCRACHSQRGSQKGASGTNAIDFASFEKFKVYLAETESLVYDQGLMPLARQTYEDFWASGSPDNQPVILARVLERELGKEIIEDDGTTRRPGRPPIADAGIDRIVGPNSEVKLNGSASLFASTFNWAIVETTPAGLTATLDGDSSVRPTFTPDVPGIYEIELVVNQGLVDSAGNDISDSDSVIVFVSESEVKPVVFNPSITNIFNNCTSCHSVSDPDGGLALDGAAEATYEAVIQRINFADPLDSLILTKPAGLDHDDRGPEQGFNLNDPDPDPAGRSDHDQVLRWILEGALLTTGPEVPNNAPEIISGPVETAEQDDAYTYDVDALDPDVGDTLTFSLDNPPVGMVIDPATGLIAWTPTNAQVGVNNITVQVQDTGGLIDTQSFDISVANINDPPEITSTAITGAVQDVLYNYDVEAADPDVGDTLSFSLDVRPTGMVIDPATGVINWTPLNTDVGNHNVTIRVQDAAGDSNIQSFTIAVADANDPPVIESAAVTTATANNGYTYDVEATDPDVGDTLTYSLDVKPVGMEIDSATGVIDWTPASTQVGNHNVTVRVQDTGGLPAIQTFTITVAPSVSFLSDVRAIFNDDLNCGTCHGGATGTFGGLDLIDPTNDAVFNAVLPRVNSTTPAESLILTKPSQTSGITHALGGVRAGFFAFDISDCGPDTDTPISNYCTILRWIQEGAQNN